MRKLTDKEQDLLLYAGGFVDVETNLKQTLDSLEHIIYLFVVSERVQHDNQKYIVDKLTEATHALRELLKNDGENFSLDQLKVVD
ncbi:hypothetical protein [Streptococcus suis]|uniref:Uncharacterized protein n=1 Tax=Streptococcus suis TaxID=1307 RepID=A0A426T3P8_STRSU|nr:hypothetical protein [Streptococcus suis]MBY4967180.1 hypothetical protein [Streptococcus suis]MDW8778456.1 hypothetical protein [Streptococcus suis]RRN51167.1 hypothetical protein EI220_05230 [Streptococcus suis]RRR47813.1 hypothetical protein EJA00_07080 [Streptococcus suis]TIH99092.1 hypothetical protein FAJ35_11005 [Streptococcus suis]